MIDYTILRCPYCKNVWSRRGEHMPISCPKCKKRFDYPGNWKKPEETKVTAESYTGLRDWLADANRFSRQCESLDEVCDRVQS